MTKIDLVKERKDIYNPGIKTPVFVDIPKIQYLMIDGKGDPNTSKLYQDSIMALFNVSYTLKFMVKKGPLAIDYKVMPLEGLWWSEDMQDFAQGKKDNWKWTVMIRQPDFVDAGMLKDAVTKVVAKLTAGKTNMDAVIERVNQMRLEMVTDGKCATIMHIGPFTAEGPTIERLHRFIIDNGYKLSGKHREIYLSDIRKADPTKWKTVIRQPVKQ